MALKSGRSDIRKDEESRSAGMPAKTWCRKAKNPGIDLNELRAWVRYWPITGRWTRNPGVRRGRLGGIWADVGETNGYRIVSILAQRFLSHRLAWLFMTGEWPPLDMVVDHINGDPNDNRWANLRLATHKQNIRNQKKQTRNTSGFKGVSLDKRTGKFRAQIRVDAGEGVRVLQLGDRFPTPEQAAAAYAKAAHQYHGEFARTA